MEIGKLECIISVMRNILLKFSFGLTTVSMGKYEFVNLSYEPLCKVLAFSKHWNAHIATLLLITSFHPL